MGDILDAIGANVKWQVGGVCNLKGEMKGEREREGGEIEESERG